MVVRHRLLLPVLICMRQRWDYYWRSLHMYLPLIGSATKHEGYWLPCWERRQMRLLMRLRYMQLPENRDRPSTCRRFGNFLGCSRYIASMSSGVSNSRQ